jgi:hypothetical protein
MTSPRPPHQAASAPPRKPGAPRKAIFDLIVACRDEAQQRELFERLAREGFKCRVITA